MNEAMIGGFFVYITINIITLVYMFLLLNDYKSKLLKAEVEIFDNVKEYFETRIEKVESTVLWHDFNPKSNIHLERGPDGKFNPNEVPGALDDLFGAK